MAGGEFFEVAQGMEEPIAQEASAHGCVGAIEDGEEGVGGAGAGVYEVEVFLGCVVDEDVVVVFEEAGRVEVVAGASELGAEVVEGGTGGGACGMEVGAAEAFEGMDFEM